MRLLFEMDRHDYDDCTRVYVRNASRSVIIHGGKIAMVHSMKYDYYKCPGGGIEKGEDAVAAMIRETREEAGLLVIPETVREFGYVHRIEKNGGDPSVLFLQNTYYYLCEVRETVVPQELVEYEAAENYTLEFISPHDAILKNRSVRQSPYNPISFEREAKVLEMLIAEGYF